MITVRVLALFAVFSTCIVLQGCGGGSTTTTGPTTTGPTTTTTTGPTTTTVTTMSPKTPPNGHGTDDIGVYIYNHNKLAFTVFTSMPDKGTWVNRGPPIPEADWDIDDTIVFDKALLTRHGGLDKVETQGAMTVTLSDGTECKLNYGHDGVSTATASTDCDDPQVVHASVDPNTGQSINFEISGLPVSGGDVVL